MKQSINFNLKNITKYRSAIMGFAMIWVMALHYHVDNALIYFTRLGFTGVDIFLFLSSYGLYFSLSKNVSLSRYYKRRVLRIFPTYIIIVLFSSIICFGDSFTVAIAKCTTLGYWLNGVYNDWYIPTLLVLYSLFPLIYRSLTSSQTKVLAYLILGCFVIAILERIGGISNLQHNGVIYRIPIFIAGALVAHNQNTYEEVVAKKKYLKYSLLLLIPFFLLYPLSLDFISHGGVLKGMRATTTFAVPAFIILLVFIFKKMPLLATLLSYIGESSLEIYLIHCIPKEMHMNWLDSLLDKHHNITILVMGLSIVIIGILLHKILTKITNTAFSLNRNS